MKFSCFAGSILSAFALTLAGCDNAETKPAPVETKPAPVETKPEEPKLEAPKVDAPK